MDLTKKRKLDENGLLRSDFDLSVADARKIIEPFTHEQLLEIVQNAAVRHLDVLVAVRSIADRDPTQRKLFIRGLGWDTTNENLAAIFSTYGELDEAVVILDKTTGKSKGFGFVTFKHIDGALRALKEPSKKIDGRMTVTNLASAGLSGGAMVNPQAADVSMRKIYVANVPYDMPGERLLAHFLSYGEIEEGPLGFDKATGKSKGFALFVYKTVDAARASLVDPIKNIDGHQLNCKLANDGKRAKPPGSVAVQAESHGNGIGLHQAGAVAGSVGAAQYGGPGGMGGNSAYAGGYTGGLHGALPQSHPLNSSYTSPAVGGLGLSSLSSQASSSLGFSSGYSSGVGGPYSGSQYGGPGYGGLVGAGSGIGAGVAAGLSSSGTGLVGVGSGSAAGMGGAASGLGGAASGLGGAASGLGGAASGLGGPGRMTSLYGLQPNSAGVASGGYSQSAHYSLSGGSGYQSQHHQTAGTSPASRVPYPGTYPSRY